MREGGIRHLRDQDGDGLEASHRSQATYRGDRLRLAQDQVLQESEIDGIAENSEELDRLVG